MNLNPHGWSIWEWLLAVGPEVLMLLGLMAWGATPLFRRRKPSPLASDPVEQERQQGPAEVDLAILSVNDLKEWLGSPFWLVLCQWLDQEIEMNREALERGDVAIEQAGQTGALYRSDEGLRGGIIGMRFVRDLFPGQAEAEILAAQQERIKEEE